MIQSEGRAATMGVQRKIMVVDDDKDWRDLLCLRLQEAGFEALVAANGLRLVSSLRINRPDLIILDVMMSWIDGFELCTALKANQEFRDIPVIFISGRTSREDIDHGYACGCADYFTKPLDYLALIKRIEQITTAPQENGI